MVRIVSNVIMVRVCGQHSSMVVEFYYLYYNYPHIQYIIMYYKRSE